MRLVELLEATSLALSHMRTLDHMHFSLLSETVFSVVNFPSASLIMHIFGIHL